MPPSRGLTGAARGRAGRIVLLAALGATVAAGAVSAATPAPGSDLIRSLGGTGLAYDDGDGDAAGEAGLTHPRSIAQLADGSILVSSPWTNRVRRIAPDGTVSTAVGTGRAGFAGDGGPAAEAEVNFVHGTWPLPDGGFVVADTLNNRIRKVSASGVITTLAGNGTAGYSGDGGPAALASINNPRGVAVTPDGSVLIPDSNNHRVRRVAPDGVITTVAGTGVQGFAGDGGSATAARLSIPFAVAPTADGGFLIADVGNQRIRKVSVAGQIATVAGNGVGAFAGDGGPATSASVRDPHAVFGLPDGGFLIADTSNQRIRQVDTAGMITTVAGTGASGYSGDDGPAAGAALDAPKGVWVTPDGFVLVADEQNGRIRAVGTPRAPVSLSPPSIVGVGAKDATLTALAGGWGGSTITVGPVHAYAWERCDEAGASCAPIPGATEKSYRLGAADVGATVRVRVTASTPAGSAEATSAASAVVTDGLVGPQNLTPPAVAGMPVEGQPLTADPGAWSGTQPIDFAYTWQRCDAMGTACADITGASAATHVPSADDIGSTLRVIVRASNAAGTSAHHAVVVGAGAEAAWRLGETAGPAADLVGGRDGVYVNMPARGEPGLVPGATDGSVRFANGAGAWGQYVEIPGSPDWTAGPFSLELVVRADVTPTNRTLWAIVSNAQPFRGWWLHTDGAGRPRLFIGNGASWRADPASTATPLQPGDTVHLVATYDGQVGRLFVDGDLVSTVGDDQGTDPPVSMVAPPAATPMRIGGFLAPSPAANQFWPGSVDEAAFYGSPLAADLVAQHAETTVSDNSVTSAASAAVAPAPPPPPPPAPPAPPAPAPPASVPPAPAPPVPPVEEGSTPLVRRAVFTASRAGDGDVRSVTGVRSLTAGTAVVRTRAGRLVVARNGLGGETSVSVAFVLFDTSSLPAGARITGATLLLRTTGRRSYDRRRLVVERYAPSRWPLDARDFAPAAPRRAAGAAALATLVPGRVARIRVALASVSSTGRTGFRLHVSGVRAPGRNVVAFASADQRGLAVPRLVVEYTLP